MKLKNIIINIILIILGIILSSKFTAFYEWGIGTLFYFNKGGNAFPRLALVAGIIFLHLIITQGIVFFIYKKIKRKVLIIVSLYNIVLTILIATMNIAILIR